MAKVCFEAFKNGFLMKKWQIIYIELYDMDNVSSEIKFPNMEDILNYDQKMDDISDFLISHRFHFLVCVYNIIDGEFIKTLKIAKIHKMLFASNKSFDNYSKKALLRLFLPELVFWKLQCTEDEWNLIFRNIKRFQSQKIDRGN